MSGTIVHNGRVRVERQSKRTGQQARCKQGRGTTNGDLHDGTPVGIELQERNRIHFVGVNEALRLREDKVIPVRFPAPSAQSAITVTLRPGMSQGTFSGRFWA
ncbi:hypothetical protein [Stenotrophomonas sp. CC22-02]|uniref:hypothetical protein n=1 Tax=Stenotrophomonas sp. CC22-02 TaxID=1378087 RepID=UPI001416F66C|nr:hypothetical protein [Stenotrophomonas sp. CC22-02]